MGPLPRVLTSMAVVLTLPPHLTEQIFCPNQARHFSSKVIGAFFPKQFNSFLMNGQRYDCLPHPQEEEHSMIKKKVTFSDLFCCWLKPREVE